MSDLSQSHILFGQQHSSAYGHFCEFNENGNSDVKMLVGSNPGVNGADFSDYTAAKGDKVLQEKAKLLKLIKESYKRGQLVTFAWHAPNPANGGKVYFSMSKVAAVPLILPGRKYHSVYKMYLDRIADFALEAKNDEGEQIPFIFRPFHEFDGDWFWWGEAHCTREEFIQIWRFTVHYLKDVRKVHSIIYAFSPDKESTTDAEYLNRYPGDDYVDMLGIDNYRDLNPWHKKYKPGQVTLQLRMITRLAAQKNKLAALTETGWAGLPKLDWFTQNLLPVLKDNQIRLVYALVWRNAIGTDHFHTPFPGHKASADFKKFYADEKIWFENDLKEFGLYK